MGYDTTFKGKIEIYPPLNQEEIDYLIKFSETRRMDRKKGPYFVDGSGWHGQYRDPDVNDFNSPPHGQPGLWCQWIPTNNGKHIVWDGGEKFYGSLEWMDYLITHFIGDNPIAKSELPFLRSHTCNGIITAKGENKDDRWCIAVVNNVTSKYTNEDEAKAAFEHRILTKATNPIIDRIKTPKI